VRLNEAEARALVELFSVVNDVFTEPDAFEPAQRAIGFGRTYRAWKRARRVLAAQTYTPLTPRPPSEATG
jgi:hypothetical protein